MFFALIFLISISVFSQDEDTTNVFYDTLKIQTDTVQNQKPIKENKKKKEQQVYICDSGKSKVYHLSKQCSALNSCKYQIISMDLSEAQKQYRQCKKCY